MRFIKAAVSADTEECIIWPYGTASGYGLIRYKGKMRRASRLALILSTRQDPEELVAAHGRCHNRLCINPKHLSWKTATENCADKKRDGTAQQGQDHPRSKLSLGAVKSILADARPAAVVARDHKVAVITVYKIKSGERWKHLSKSAPHQ